MELSDDKQLVADFVAESREQMAGIESQLLEIEAAGQDADPALVNEVFRAIHSIKGAAGFLGFHVLGQLAHHLENVLNLVRNRQLVPDSQVTEVMLRSADALRALLDDVDHSNERNVDQYVDLLEKVVSNLLAEESNPVPAMVLEPKATPTAEAASPASTDETDERPACETGKVLPSGAPQEGSHSRSETNIRVPVAVLDLLMNLAGELVLARNQLLQAVNSRDKRFLESVASRVNQVTSELQETIMQTRLQTIGTVFNKLPRVIRDLSNLLGKQCQLSMEGQEVELDKSIIEAIGAPMTHLIRNAIDHGIETPEVRAQSGKPAVGKVSLQASHQAGKVHIVLQDDGAGINVEKIRQKAVSRGIISPDQARELSEREVLQLIFRPGFSTAEQVTEVSGRGVGMDVVKTSIERLGGTVAVETELGRGSTFRIKLPLTLAIVPALIVCCRGNRFAIPQGNISELVRVRAREANARIQRIKNAEVLRLRDELLPLVRLDSALKLDESRTGVRSECGTKGHRTGADRVWNIIVVEAGHLRYGLIVEGLHDSEEIVVKPLGRHLKNCPCLAGATILGDGTVAMILDVASVAAQCHLAPSGADQAANGEAELAEKGVETAHLLLFRNAPTEQFAVPMQAIARMERIAVEKIDRVGGRRVLQYRGGSLPLLSLEDHIQAQPSPPSHRGYVIVFSIAGREAGLLVHELVDVRKVSVAIDASVFREPGVIGSLIVDGRTTRLLDLTELAEAAHPEWLPKDRRGPAKDADRPTIVLAEDSDFFRAHVAGFLENAGYRVLAYPDGKAAWDAMRSPGAHVDLLITDLEMPRMDGFELASRVRSEPSLEHLPTIAVTSLAGEEDQRRALTAGVDQYQIKLDRERLLAAVEQCVRKGNARAISSREASYSP